MDVYMVDHRGWFDWRGKGEPEFPPRDMPGIETITFEAETSTVGSNWEVLQDDMASNGKFGRYHRLFIFCSFVSLPVPDLRGHFP